MYVITWGASDGDKGDGSWLRIAKVAAAVVAGAAWEAVAATEECGMRRKGEWLLAEVHAAALIDVSATRRVSSCSLVFLWSGCCTTTFYGNGLS